MKVIETYSPIYHVELNHPDTGSEFHRVVIDDEGDAPSIFADDEEWKAYNDEVMRRIWDMFNLSGYYHTMTITAEYVIEGKAVNTKLCEEVGRYELF